MATRVIGLMGSQHRGAPVDTNVSAVLQACRERGAEVAKIDLVNRRIEFCDDCETCLLGPGQERGVCVIEDDSEAILTVLESADALVLGAPLNFGGSGALARHALQQMAGYSYWPWDGRRPRKPRRERPRRKQAVLVTSSAAPGLFARVRQAFARAVRRFARSQRFALDSGTKRLAARAAISLVP